MSALVYVHGTNGSGKSTLARALLAAAGGSVGYESHATKPDKCGSTYTHAGLVFVGRYETACGGVDGIHPYALVHGEMQRTAVEEGSCFAEGLITPGVQTCTNFAGLFDHALFIHLCTPEKQCIINVHKRRKEAGNTKPYDPANLMKKALSAAHWADRLERAGLKVARLSYTDALQECLFQFGLPPYDIL